MTVTKMETRMKRMEEAVRELTAKVENIKPAFSYGDLITTAHIVALDRDNKIVGITAPVEVQWRGTQNAVREGTYAVKMYKTATVMNVGLAVNGRVVSFLDCPMSPTFADLQGTSTLNVVTKGFR